MQSCSLDFFLPWSKAFIQRSSSPLHEGTVKRRNASHLKKAKEKKTFTAVPSSWDIFNQNWRLTYISVKEIFFFPYGYVITCAADKSQSWTSAANSQQEDGGAASDFVLSFPVTPGIGWPSKWWGQLLLAVYIVQVPPKCFSLLQDLRLCLCPAPASLCRAGFLAGCLQKAVLL